MSTKKLVNHQTLYRSQYNRWCVVAKTNACDEWEMSDDKKEGDSMSEVLIGTPTHPWKLVIVVLLVGIFAGFIVGVFVERSFYSKPLENEVGVCLHLPDYDNQTTISNLIDLGINWVRTDWEITFEYSMSDYSQSLQHNNINLLAIIDHKTFEYRVPTLEEWNRTITELVNSQDFKNTDSVEIWNEPNSVSFIEPDVYYEMLKSAYTIIKNYKDVPVVFAGVSPEVEGWKAYLNIVFAHNDTEDYFDYMGIHLYGNMTGNIDTLQFVRGSTSKPIWLTETGKPSGPLELNYTAIDQAEYLS
jgi:hypothetical protein